MKKYLSEKNIKSVLRICLSWIFLWAFFDKLFGLGFSTEVQNAWINGGSPTAGFLLHATRGPFEGLFKILAGSFIVDWLFMLGLLGIGTSLLIKRVYRFGSCSGMVLLSLMYLAALPAQHNPLVDEHIVYILVLLYLFVADQKTKKAQ